jgi:hypothetical protein
MLEVVLAVASKTPSDRLWPRAVKSAGVRSASRDELPLVSTRGPFAVWPQEFGYSDRNQMVEPQLTVQLQEALLLTHANPLLF